MLPTATGPPVIGSTVPGHDGSRRWWIAMADRLLGALRPYDSPLGARIDLPGRGGRSGPAVDGFEAFSRSFLLASLRIAATRGEGCEALIDRYAMGLAAGTAAAGPESWPRIASRSLTVVESSTMAISLHESREWLWDRLDDPIRQRVVDWLSGAIGAETPDNNWVLFRAVTEEFLASVGADHRRSDIDHALNRIDDWDRGDGWYTDGDGQNFDHYNAFVLHPYLVFWARMAERSGVHTTSHLDRYRSRLSAFLGQYQHLIGPDGAPVLQGRSTTYRMAMLAPFWAGELVDATPLRPGQTRALCSRVLRHFVDNGAPDQNGLLTLGWHAPHPLMTQAYSGPGSPYWAAHGFLGLLLPAEHPVWVEPETELPGDGTDRIVSMPAPGFLVHSTAADQIVRMVNHGSDHARTSTDPTETGPALDPHYGRYCYTNRTGPDLPQDGELLPVDNGVHLVASDGRVSRRGRIHRLAIGADHASSWSPVVWGGTGLPTDLRVEVTSIVHGGFELRCIRVLGPLGDHATPTLIAGGHALAADRPPADQQGSDRAGRPWANVSRADGTTSAVWGVTGCETAEVRTAVGANPFGRYSATPAVRARPSTDPVLVLIALTADPVASLVDHLDVVREVTDDSIVVRLPGAPANHHLSFATGSAVVTRAW